MATVARELLTRTDTTWLHAETATNHFVVTSLAILDGAPHIDRLRTMLGRRISTHPRLRQVVQEPRTPFAPPAWVPAPHFDLDAHIHRLALPKPAGKAELAALIGDLIGQPLDFERPLWSVYAVDGPGGGGAIIGRFHHSLGDGQAMVRLLLTLTDRTADAWTRRPRTRPRRPSKATGDGRGAAGRLAGALMSAPQLARTAVQGAGTLARLTLLDPDRPNPLRGQPSLLKAVSWTDPIPLDLLKRMARSSGTTVNDVIVSAIAGGIGAYLRRSGVDTRGLRIRAMVPVNLRPPDDAGMEGNKFSLVYLEMPVGVIDEWERLMRVKIEMDRIKASLEPAAGWILVQGLGFLPGPLEHAASSFYADKATLVLTNVIGPQHRLYLAGSRITEMTFWEPESGGLGVGVSIYSYAGQITVGVVSDRHLVARPELITAEVLCALRALDPVRVLPRTVS